MKQTKMQLGMFLAALVSVVALAGSPVYARHGSDNMSGDSTATTSEQMDMSGDNSGSGNSGSGGSGSDSSSSDDGMEAEANDTTEMEVEHNVTMFKQHGKMNLTARRQNASGHSVAKRQQVCQNIQKAVNNKLLAFDNHADSYLIRLNSTYTKLKDYQSSKNIQVANWSDLQAAANSKQAAATTSVDALKALGSSVDCTSSDPAGMLASVKAGATSTRDALKAYRTALKNIVVALAQANGTKDASTSTEGN